MDRELTKNLDRELTGLGITKRFKIKNIIIKFIDNGKVDAQKELLEELEKQLLKYDPNYEKEELSFVSSFIITKKKILE